MEYWGAIPYIPTSTSYPPWLLQELDCLRVRFQMKSTGTGLYCRDRQLTLVFNAGGNDLIEVFCLRWGMNYAAERQQESDGEEMLAHEC